MTASFYSSSSRRTGISFAWLILVLALSGCAASREAPAPESSAVREHLKQHLYLDAERAARRLKTQRETSSPDSLLHAQALDLLVEVLVQAGKVAQPDALTTAEQAIRIKEHLGANDLELARSSELLGIVHTERGEFVQALPRHQYALTIRRRRFGVTHSLIADSLDHVALALIRLERFKEARQALDESIAIRTALQRSTLAHARTLELQGLLRRYEGEYALALQALDESAALQKQFAPVAPEMASILHVRGDVVWLQGNIEGGRRLWSEALGIVERTLGSHHPMIAPLVRKLALAANAVGDLPGGRRLRERGLQIAEESLGPCHPERPNLLSDLALSLIYDGEYINAQKNYELAVDLYKRCLGERHSLVATAIYNQADLASQMGDLAEAERLHQSAIALWSSILGAQHPYVARAVDGLAEVQAKRGRYDAARLLYARALKIRQESVGPNHPDVAWTLTNLANTAAASGELKQAVAYATEAVDIYKRAGGADVPDHLARVLEQRGILELEQGRRESAQRDVTEALELRRKTFGAGHPLVAATLVQLARVSVAFGRPTSALSTALEAERIARDHLRFTIRYLPERQALAYAATRPSGLSLAFSIATRTTAFDASAVFDAVIRSRGIVFDEMAARAQLIAKTGSSETASTQRLHLARQRFANLVLRSLQPDENVLPAVLDAARREKEQAERDVADGTARGELRSDAMGLPEIRHSLPTGSALVSFVRYSTTNASATTAGPASQLSAYIAFVTRSDSGHISMHRLGSAEVIDRLVSDWRRHITQLSPEREVRVAGQRLIDRVWVPLTKEITGAERVFIVPDGALSFLNFSALPSKNGRYLIEDGPLLHYLATERDLLTSSTTSGSGGLLAIGGVAFDEIPQQMRKMAARADQQKGEVSQFRGGCIVSAPLRFEPLTATAQEVADIGHLWSSLRPMSPVMLFGKAATEEAVRAAVTGQAVIHFATHGFFLGSDCKSPVAGTRAVGGLSKGDTANATSMSENPLSLAGLALTGANRSSSNEADDAEDGILTAEEVAGLNLQGTQWAVLSACDTGIGEITTGEGVFGLRRAFQIAGAKTVIMSLWSVEDQSTREWMHFLYEARLRDKFDTVDAVAAATLRMLRDRRRSQLSTHPFYWAAFVASGDWR